MNAKFRAYSKTAKKWMYFTLQEIAENCFDWNSYIWWGQWTGKVDMLDVEIYQDDKVNITVMDGGLHETIATVVWDEKYSMWSYDKYVAGMFNHLRAGRCAVLGPKWENPDL